ncbi:hypothetical protein KJ854_00755 [Patescibacteria group bacterium]|nr:hypothetical protein [Patescibacteria group bacterium]
MPRRKANSPSSPPIGGYEGQSKQRSVKAEKPHLVKGGVLVWVYFVV